MSGFRRAASQPGSGFRRAASQPGGRPRPRVPGGRPVGPQQQLTVTSCGVSALDALIGGGLAVSSVCVLDEDATTAYAAVLTRYFIAQSLLDGQHVLLISCDSANTEYLLANLPDVEDAKIGGSPAAGAATRPLNEVAIGGHGEADEGLEIAWRYRNAPQFEERHSLDTDASSARKFDLSKKLDAKKLEEATGSGRLERLDLAEFGTFTENAEQALARIRALLLERIEFQCPGQPSDDARRSLLKLVIPGFASALWGCIDDDSEVLRFLYTIQVLCSEHLCTAWITVPAWLRIQRPVLCERMCQLSDYWLRLESLGDSRTSTNPLYKDLHGLLTLDKLPCLGSMAPVARPDTLEFGFKVRRKAFFMQRLHLPPDISETASRASKPRNLTCGSSVGTPIDF